MDLGDYFEKIRQLLAEKLGISLNFTAFVSGRIVKQGDREIVEGRISYPCHAEFTYYPGEKIILIIKEDEQDNN